MSGKQARLRRRLLREAGQEVDVVDLWGQSAFVGGDALGRALHPVGVRVFTGTFRRPNIMCCLPSATGFMPLEVHLSLLQLVAPLNGTVDYYCLSKCPVDVARNMFVERALGLRERPDYIMFIGDDMLPQYDGLILLWEEAERSGWDVLGGLYHWKSEPRVPLVWRDSVMGHPTDEMVQSLADERGVVPCDVCGMDFTLVRLSVFDRLGTPPWFKTAVWEDEEGGITKVTEDSFFCRRVGAVGGRVAVHVRVPVGHLDVKTGKIY